MGASAAPGRVGCCVPNQDAPAQRCPRGAGCGVATRHAPQKACASPRAVALRRAQNRIALHCTAHVVFCAQQVLALLFAGASMSESSCSSLAAVQAARARSTTSVALSTTSGERRFAVPAPAAHSMNLFAERTGGILPARPRFLCAHAAWLRWALRSASRHSAPWCALVAPMTAITS